MSFWNNVFQVATDSTNRNTLFHYEVWFVILTIYLFLIFVVYVSRVKVSFDVFLVSAIYTYLSSVHVFLSTRFTFFFSTGIDSFFIVYYFVPIYLYFLSFTSFMHTITRYIFDIVLP